MNKYKWYNQDRLDVTGFSPVTGLVIAFGKMVMAPGLAKLVMYNLSNKMVRLRQTA